MKRVIAVLACCLWASLTCADFQAGVDAYNKEAYATALREFKPLAMQGESQ